MHFDQSIIKEHLPFRVVRFQHEALKYIFFSNNELLYCFGVALYLR